MIHHTLLNKPISATHRIYRTSNQTILFESLLAQEASTSPNQHTGPVNSHCISNTTCALWNPGHETSKVQCCLI